MNRALLLLADGSRFEGRGLGPEGTSRGEAVFFTGPTGYEEALTDPSYAGQILVFCYPLIGNYGIDPRVRQHKTICAAGAVFKRASRHPSHYRSRGSLPDWLAESRVRAIEGIDTRALVTRLRSEGTMRAVLAVGASAIGGAETQLGDYLRQPLATPALVDAMQSHGELNRDSATVDLRIGLLDCGAKANIANCLAAAGAIVVEVPAAATFEELRKLELDGLVVSNGPGDPSELGEVVALLRQVVAHEQLPLLGVCLGHQLLALALGATTFKMKYGHRGGNQPVLRCASGDVIITAQNHGYAVDPATLPADVEQTMINLNDGTNEGLRHRRLPILSVQFHPEASPGPTDARPVFAEFLDICGRRQPA